MNLRALIANANLRQKEVAERLGATEYAVSRWVNGQADVPGHFIRPLADLLGVGVATIIEVGIRDRRQAPDE